MPNVSLVDGHIDEPKITCKNCKYLMFSDFEGECSKGYKGIVKPWDSCEHAELSERYKPKVITNYDRIRNMSIEDFADLLFYNYRCQRCAFKNGFGATCGLECKEGIKKWLEQEVEE